MIPNIGFDIMPSVSLPNFLNNQASFSSILQQPTHNTPNTPESTKTPAAPSISSAIYSNIQTNKKLITRIALGILGTLALAATVYYNYDRLNGLNVSVKGPDPLPTPNGASPTPAEAIGSFYEPELTQNPSPNGIPVVPADINLPVNEQTLGTNEFKMPLETADTISESVKQEDPAIHGTSASQESESQTLGEFYEENKTSVISLGLLIVAINAYVWKKILDLNKNEMDPLLPHKQNILLTGPNNPLNQVGDDRTKKNVKRNSKENDLDHDREQPLIISTPTKNGPVKKEVLKDAIREVYEDILKLEKDGAIDLEARDKIDPIMERIKDLSTSILQLWENGKSKDPLQNSVIEQLEDAGKVLQLSIATLSPVKKTAIPTKNVEGLNDPLALKEYNVSNDQGANLAIGNTQNEIVTIGSDLPVDDADSLNGSIITAARDGKTAGKAGRGGRGGPAKSLGKASLTPEELHKENEKKKIERNWKERAKSFDDFKTHSREAKAKIAQLEILTGIHENYKNENEKLGLDSDQYLSANQKYKNALAELENFKKDSIAPIPKEDGIEKFKKFMSQELLILKVIFDRHRKKEKVDLIHDKPFDADMDRWIAFTEDENEWGQTLMGAGWFKDAIEDRLTNRTLKSSNKKVEMEPSEVIPPYVAKEPKTQKKLATAKKVILTPMDELKKFFARKPISVKNNDPSGLDSLNTPSKLPFDKAKTDEISNAFSAYEDNSELLKEFEVVAITKIIQDQQDGLQAAIQDGLFNAPIIRLKTSIQLLTEYMNFGVCNQDVLELVESYQDEINDSINHSLVKHAQDNLKLSEDEAKAYANDIMETKKAATKKIISDIKIVPKNLNDAFKESQSETNSKKEEQISKKVKQASKKQQQVIEENNPSNPSQLSPVVEPKTKEITLPKPLDDVELDLYNGFFDKAVEAKIKEFRHDIVEAKKKSDEIAVNALKASLKSFNEYLYDRSEDGLVVHLVETEYLDELNGLVRQSLEKHAQDTLKMSQDNAKAYAERLIESNKVTPKKVLARPEPTKLDDLLEKLTGVQPASHKLLSEDDAKLIKGFEEKYYRAVLGQLELANDSDDETVENANVTFDSKKPLHLLQEYFKSGQQTTNVDVLEYIEGHQEGLNEHILECLKEHATTEKNMSEEDAIAFADEVMKSKKAVSTVSK